MVRLLTITYLLLVALGCVTPRGNVACLSRDWFELGRSDGAQGLTTNHTEQYQKECGRTFDAHAELIYANGRNKGLVEFCQPDNAFEMGRMGLKYSFVCPNTMEGPFLSAYRRGQQTRLR